MIGRCIRSIQALILPTWIDGCEIIVVDNESTDDTSRISRELNAKVVSSKPGIAARVRNVGASHSNADWLAFIDADCEVQSDWLAKCLEVSRKDTAVIAVGSRVEPPLEGRTWVTSAWQAFVGSSPNAGEEQKRWLTTQGLLVRRNSFEKVGGFDETLETCEDCDLGYRLCEHGLIVLVNNALLVHHGESNSLREVFLREAWRTKGNLSLAFRRPTDIVNWISLLIPAFVVGSLLIGSLWTIFSFSFGTSPTWPLTLLFLATIVLACLVLLKSKSKTRISDVLQQSVVMMTYLAGRACGLFFRFRRLPR